jgi:hypothetical protein
LYGVEFGIGPADQHGSVQIHHVADFITSQAVVLQFDEQ